jgi:hypothetical protein
MAARRLIIVLLVLMGISTIAAILAPPIEDRSSDTDTESTTAAGTEGEPGAGEEGSTGVLIEQTIGAFGKQAVLGGVVGDRLALTVTSPRPTNVQVPALGLFEFADRGAPARFDLFLREEARYVVERDDGTAIATIEVAGPTPAPAGPERPPAGKRS